MRADLRRRGIGQELLRLAEARARERGCHSAWLDTFSFPAPEFYPKFGYKILGHIADRGNAWIARRIDIANHCRAQFPES